MQRCWREILVGTWLTHVVKIKLRHSCVQWVQGKTTHWNYYFIVIPYTVRIMNIGKSNTQIPRKVFQFLMRTEYYSPIKIKYSFLFFFLFYFSLLWTFERTEKYVKAQRLHRFDEWKRTLDHNNISPFTILLRWHSRDREISRPRWRKS